MREATSPFHFNKISDTPILDNLKNEWRKSLIAPQDGMWESLTDHATHWEISDEIHSIGYACVNEENCLLQFYVLAPYMHEGVSIFRQFIHQQSIDKGLIGTNNPTYLSMAMHLQKVVEVNTYLFMDYFEVDVTDHEGEFGSAAEEDLESLVEFGHNSMGGPKEWLTGYIGGLIARGEYFVLTKESEILGTCEVRRSASNPEVADVGMVISAKHRRKGLGTFMLGKAKEISQKWNLRPICSCEKDNLGSLKAIRANGFRSVHQMLLMEF